MDNFKIDFAFSQLKISEISMYVYGAYNKFKHLVYYSSSYLIYKNRIAEFEAGCKEERLSLLIKNLHNDLTDLNYLERLYDGVDFYPVIKNESEQGIKLNYFIDIPIELHILDVIWTIIKGMSFKFDDAEKHWYGN